MTIDLNRLPYFDDYNEDKRFHKILFKPGVAVQARELTQLQTILQNQIQRFGDHIFKNGSIVLGGAFDPQDPIDYVRVTLTDSAIRTNLINKELTGLTTGLKAYVVHAEVDPLEAGVTVLFIRYSNSSLTATTFGANETLQNSVQNLTTTTLNATGKGSIFGLGEGVVYVQGFFIKFESQKIAIDPFNVRPSKRVYFRYQFDTVDSNGDPSLLDNAQGFNNYAAPGADRLRATVTLAVSDLDETLPEEEYTLLLEVKNGEIKKVFERSQYARVYDEIAKRTFDESGDYVVYGLQTYSREHLDTGNNEGLFLAGDGGDANLFVVGVQSGLAYVKGYEVNNYSTRYLEAEKALTYTNVDNQISYVRSGSYVTVNEITGIPDPDKANVVNLYDTAETRVSNSVIYDTSPAGSKIGEARMAAILLDSGQLGQPDAQVRLYLTNIEMNENKTFQQVRSIQNSNFFADVVLTGNNAVISDLGINNRLMYAGSDYIRNLKDENGNDDTSFIFQRQKTGTISSGGTLTITITTTDESMPYGTGTLGSIAKDTIFLNVEANTTFTLSGNADITTGSANVTGVGTSFTNLNVGDRLSIDSNAYVIESIANNTHIVLTENASSTYSGAFSKLYLKGDYIDLSSKGSDSGAIRSVTATSSSLTFNLQETFGTTVPCKVTHRAARNNAAPANKIRRSNRIVLIDGSTAANLDIIPLGFSDIIQVRQIRKHSSAFSLITDGTDVTSDFIVDDGQTASSYENGFLIPRTSGAFSNTDYLLVELDYFEPDFSTGVGYFSIDSYPIDDTQVSNTTIQTIDLPFFNSAEDRISYPLRNFIDTRPIKTNTATNAVTIGTASTNPAFSTTFNTDANGLRLPVPGTNITYDYSYYLGRRDSLVISPDGGFKLIKGRPSLNPGVPIITASDMLLAHITIPPYPSISTRWAAIRGRGERSISHQNMSYVRQTQRDLSALKKRVKNLEYYTLINNLEQSTLNLTFVDDNGLDRFKNGIFVDPFADHSLGIRGDADYKVANDSAEKTMRPRFIATSLKGAFESGTNVRRGNNLITLPFTEETFIENSAVTTTRNVEFSSYRFIGNIALSPDTDTWVDSETVTKVVDVETGVAALASELVDSGVLDTEWTAWKTISSTLVNQTSTTETTKSQS